jgi:DNA ligase-1
VPTNARTCKHLKSLLGDKYEAARLKMKNPHGPPPKGSPKKKPTSKAKGKAPAKRKRADDEDEDGDDGDAKPAKKTRKPASSAKGRSKAQGEDENEAQDGGDDDEPEASGQGAPELLLANKWDIETGLDPTGWWISEKLDGVRFVNRSQT